MRNFLCAMRVALATATAGLPATADEVTLPSGTRLAFKEAGSGPRTMILIHGWSLSTAVWEKILATPPAGYKLVAYDIRGFGDSSQPADGYDYPTLVQDLREFMKARGIEKAVLSGHSLGSFFIQDFAAAYPEAVEALILTSPQPRTMKLALSEPIQKIIDSVGPDKDRKALMAQNTPRYFAPGNLPPADAERFIAIGAKASPIALQTTFRTAFTAEAIPAEKFAGGKIPTLVVIGTHDIVPLAVVRQIASDMPGSCSALVERAGHSSMWERPERWSAIVFGFLAAPGGGRRC